MNDFAKRYQHQLSKLNTSSERFSAFYPALTEHLLRDRTDPDVAMIMQGLAYISAELEQQIEHQFPVALQAMSQVMIPTLMQPVPCASIMSYQPKKILQQPVTIPSGTYFDSNPLLMEGDSRGKSMRFQSTQALEVLPITVADVQQSQTVNSIGNTTQTITVTLDCSKADVQDYHFDSLPFYLCRPFAEGVVWYQLFDRSLSRVVVADDNGEHELPVEALHCNGMSPDNHVFNQNGGSSAAHALMQDYFLFPEKLFFFELDMANWHKRRGKKVTVRFEFSGVNSKLPDLKTTYFHLFCVPVINRFSHYAEPVQMAEFSGEYPITARLKDIGKERSLTIVDVIKVESLVEGRKRNVVYQNINNPQQLDGDNGYHYYRMQGTFGENVEDIIALQCAEQFDVEAEQVLRVKVDCCHGHRGSQLNPGDICRATTNTPEVISYRNITPCSEYLPPIIADESVWQLVSDQGAGVNSLTNDSELREYMKHHLPIQQKGSAFYQTSLHKIEGIQSFSVSYVDHVRDGEVFRGRRCMLELAVDHFVNLADSYVFAVLIRQLLLMATPINYGLEFNLKDNFSGESFHWPFTLGGGE